jgi:hypothetical protein
VAEQVIEVPADRAVKVLYPDGAVVEAGPSSVLRGFSPPGRGRGKHFVVASGVVTADIPRQPADQPFLITTPHGEVRVLGTRFTLHVAPGSTRLEVQEGKVRLTRADGLSAVEVAAGWFAVAAPRAPLAARPLPLERFQISFGPRDASAPPDYQIDDGAAFDEARGYGWSRDLRQSARARPSGAPLLRRHVAAGSARSADRWEIAVPNGRWRVTVSCGDPVYPQGPHRVVAEGVVLIADLMTAAGKNVAVENAPVEVKDGRLTIEVGAVGTTRTDRDGNADTTINYVVLQRIR